MDAGLDRKRAAWEMLKASLGAGGILPPTRDLERGAAPRGVRPKLTRRRPVGDATGSRFRWVPVLGYVNAGRGDASEPTPHESVRLDLAGAGVKRARETFALRVRGDSMVGAGIADGDLVILERRSARPGDVVAALIDGETTLKRLVEQDGAAFLRAENPAFADLIPLHGLQVQGVVRAVVRSGVVRRQ